MSLLNPQYSPLTELASIEEAADELTDALTSARFVNAGHVADARRIANRLEALRKGGGAG